MKFLACLLLAICVFLYVLAISFIQHFAPMWLDIIVYILGLSLGIYILTEVGRE